MKLINKSVVISAYGQAECVEVDYDGSLEARGIAGRTLVSLISPGTELSAVYFGESPYPKYPGYAAVMEVTDVGRDVQQIQPGDRVFLAGKHQLYQNVRCEDVLVLPEGLKPELAVIARLMGVSMTTLMTTAARPGDPVLIMGAGPVGYLAAHLFNITGYEVVVCDPDEHRREMLQQSGIGEVYASLDHDAICHHGSFSLVLDCSGHEAAVLESCHAVRKGGEVVLVGVPWKKNTDQTAHELLHAVFHRYIHLRSGWEWEIPIHASEFRPHSIMKNWQTALCWLKEGKIPVETLIRMYSPYDAQEVYRSLAHRSIPELFVMFDWR